MRETPVCRPPSSFPARPVSRERICARVSAPHLEDGGEYACDGSSSFWLPSSMASAASAAPYDVSEKSIAILTRTWRPVASRRNSSCRPISRASRRSTGRVLAAQRHFVEPECTRGSARARCRTQLKGSAGPAARHSHPDQRQYRNGRSDSDHGRIAGAGRQHHVPRCTYRCAAARGGSHHSGKANLSEWRTSAARIRSAAGRPSAG